MERERKKKEEKGESPSTKRESLRLPEAGLSFLPSFFHFFPLVTSRPSPPPPPPPPPDGVPLFTPRSGGGGGGGPGGSPALKQESAVLHTGRE